MTKTISSDAKLDGHFQIAFMVRLVNKRKCFPINSLVSKSVYFLITNTAQKVIQNNVLVVVPSFTLGLFKIPTTFIKQFVVEFVECKLKLTDKEILVISRIAN